MNQEYSLMIKKETALAHSRTEKAMMMLVKNIRSTLDYADLLYCLYGYFAPIEQRMQKFTPSIISDYQQRRKADAILEDLQQLKCPAPQNFTQDVPELDHAHQAFGCLYVIEGSILGGDILKKRIQAQCPDIPVAAFQYFSGYQQHTPAMWQSFLEQFNKYFAAHNNFEAAIVAANECFQKLEKWIKTYVKNDLVATPVKQ